MIEYRSEWAAAVFVCENRNLKWKWVNVTAPAQSARAQHPALSTLQRSVSDSPPRVSEPRRGSQMTGGRLNESQEYILSSVLVTALQDTHLSEIITRTVNRELLHYCC